jgi:hypothetical protein
VDHIAIGKNQQTLGQYLLPFLLLMVTGPFELLSYVPYSLPFGIGQVLLSAFYQVASDNAD